MVPSTYSFMDSQKELSGSLSLPGHSTFGVAVRIRNHLNRNDGMRFGAEITQISQDGKKRLADYTVSQTLRARRSSRDQPSRSPTLCVIHDNTKMDASLAYLDQPYQVLRQRLDGDWKPMARVSPDVLLFNLDSVNALALLPRLKGLANWQHTPAIVIAVQEHPCPDCEATVLSQFKDPAVLIDAIEQALPMKAIHTANASEAIEIQSNGQEPQREILILDLDRNVPETLVQAIGEHGFSVEVTTDLPGMNETIRRIRPVLIAVHSPLEVSLQNKIC